MTELRWVVDDTVAGRCGPNTVPWHPGALRAQGVGAVLSVNRADDVDPEALGSL